MAYKDFKFSDIRRQFGISQNTAPLFDHVMRKVVPSEPHYMTICEEEKK